MFKYFRKQEIEKLNLEYEGEQKTAKRVECLCLWEQDGCAGRKGQEHDLINNKRSTALI